MHVDISIEVVVISLENYFANIEDSRGIRKLPKRMEKPLSWSKLKVSFMAEFLNLELGSKGTKTQVQTFGLSFGATSQKWQDAMYPAFHVDSCRKTVQGEAPLRWIHIKRRGASVPYEMLR
jgi:hypothetical protein